MDVRQPAPLAPGDLVFSDFDGTISKIDTGIAVIDALDMEEAWELEHRWRRGEIDSQECLSGQWGMVDLPEEELYALVDSVEMDPTFPDFLELAWDRGVRLVVVSDGLDFYVDRLLGHLGLKTCAGEKVLNPPDGCVPRFANHCEVTPDGLEITFPHEHDCNQCGNCKTALLFALRPHFERIIYIGDGHSDMCAARYADVIFARGALAEDCAGEGRPFIPFANFDEIIAVLR